MAYEDRSNRAVLPFNPNSTTVFPIPPGGKLTQMRIILTGTVVISDGSTNGTPIGLGGPVNLIKRIKVRANLASGARYPGGDLVDCSPRSLLTYAIAQHGGKFIAEINGSTLGNGAAGTYFIYLSIPIYFADSLFNNNMRTALNMDTLDVSGNPIYQSVQVEIDTNGLDCTSMFAGNDRNINVSGLQVQYWDDRLGFSGDTTPLVQDDHDLLIGATQSRMNDPGWQMDGGVAQMLILAEQGSSRLLSDALLNRVTMTSPTLNFDEYALDLRQKMYDDELYDASQSGVGQYLIDFSHGLLGNSNAAAQMALRFDVNNVSGMNMDQLKIYTRRVFSLG